MAEPPPVSPSYGIDAPVVVGGFVAVAVAALAFAVAALARGEALGVVGPSVAALMLLGTAAVMVRGSKVGKPKLWRGLLDDLQLAGDERVLDAGCGRGLVAIETATRVPRGRVVGVDVWRARDQSGNTREAAEANAAAAGVEDRVEIVDADMVDLPFEDGQFDLVLSSLAVHAIPLAADRERACRQLARVLAPGGRIVVVDHGRTDLVVGTLAEERLVDVQRSSRRWATYPPCRVVTATKSLGKGRRR
jgi:SAM-dependent methyltransferase